MRHWNGYYKNRYEIIVLDENHKEIARCKNGPEAVQVMHKTCKSSQAFIQYHFNRPNSEVRSDDGKTYYLEFRKYYGEDEGQ